MVKGRKLFKKKNKDLPVKLNNLVYDDGKSKVPATVIFIIILLMGAYVIHDQFYKDKSKYNNYVVDNTIDIRIDNTKEYVYKDNNKIVINMNKEELRTLESNLNTGDNTFDIFISNDIVSIISYEENNYYTYNIDKEYGTIYDINTLLSKFSIYDEESISKGDSTAYFVNNNCLGLIYKDEENTLGYSSSLTHNCIK